MKGTKNNLWQFQTVNRLCAEKDEKAKHEKEILKRRLEERKLRRKQERAREREELNKKYQDELRKKNKNPAKWERER